MSGVYSTAPDTLSGLGMPEPANEHWRIANFFTGALRQRVLPLEAGTEAPTKNNKNYRVVDFAIRRFDSNGADEVLFFIEICHKGTYQNALKRTIGETQTNPYLREAFIFQYDTATWEKVKSKTEIIKTSYSDFLQLDLWEILKDFYYHIMQTS